jgi:hypothetical protein
MCRQQVAELTEYLDDFSQREAQLVVVGNGGSYDLKKFRNVTGYPGLLLTDSSLETYKLLKFKNDIIDVIGIKSFTQGFAALRAGFMPGSLQGHALQLGGAVVVVPEGKITYLFKSSAAGDHPPVEDLLAAAT